MSFLVNVSIESCCGSVGIIDFYVTLATQSNREMGNYKAMTNATAFTIFLIIATKHAMRYKDGRNKVQQLRLQFRCINELWAIGNTCSKAARTKMKAP